MKDFLNKKSWYTLIEIVMAVIISWLIIAWLGTLLQKLNWEIFNIQSQSTTFSSFSSFQNNFNTYKFKYQKSTVAIDNTTWYDVLLLLNTWSQRWVLVWVVDKTSGSSNYLKLDPVSNYDIFWDKVLAMKELTVTQTQNAISNSWSVYSILFNDTNLYPDIKVDSFVINSYNNGSILELSMDILTKFYPSYIWKDRSAVVDSSDKYRVNLSLAKDDNIYISPYPCIWTLPSWTGTILSSMPSFSSWVVWNYLWTWVTSEIGTLLACTRKCDNVWYEGNIWWVDSYTKFLLHWDWNLTNFWDNIWSITNNWSVAFSWWKFSQAMYFNWSNYLSIPDSEDWNFWNWDFTIDTWIKTSDSAERIILWQCTSAWATEWAIRVNAWVIFTNFELADTTYMNITWTKNVSDNNWHHIALIRTWWIFKLYVDWILDGTDSSHTGLAYNWTSQLSIGRAWERAISTYYWNWYIDEPRISKWIARWTSDFTPPSMAYNTLSTAMCMIDSQTTLLLHFDGNLNNSWSNIWTITNNWSVTFGWWKFWQAAYFNWSNYITIADSSDWYFWTWDFTIESWVNFASFPSNSRAGILWQRTANGNQHAFEIWFQTAGSNALDIYFDWGTLNFNWTFSWTPVTNTWYHVAVVRSGAVIKTYINGVLQSTINVDINSILDSPAQLFIWAQNSNWTPVAFFNWYIDEVRISKWVARWTSDFTPPTISY